MVAIVRPVKTLAIGINSDKGTGPAEDDDGIRAKREFQGSTVRPLCHDLERFSRLQPEFVHPRLHDEPQAMREAIDYGHAALYVLLVIHRCNRPLQTGAASHLSIGPS